MFRFRRAMSRLNRLLGRIDCPPILSSVRMSPVLKDRLSLEACEAREVPANLVWTNTADNGLFGVAANWRDLDTNVTATAAPVQGDTLIFDGELLDAPNCNTDLKDLHGFDLTETTADFAAISLVNGYSGKVTLVADATPGLSVGAFTLTSGAIAQPNGITTVTTVTETGEGGTVTTTTVTTITPPPDLSVLDTFTWTGGILNSTPSDAALNLVGATATIDPGAMNAVTTGSTIRLVARNDVTGLIGSTATFLSGTIRFAGSAELIVDNLGIFNIGAPQPQPQRPVLKFESEGPNPIGAQGVNIKAGGTLKINQGDFDSEGRPLDITGGRLILLGDSTAKFGGRVAGANFAPSIQLTDGRIDLMQGTTLTAVNGITLSKSNAPNATADLNTFWNPAFAGAQQSQPTATIKGNLINRGADVGMCHDMLNRLKFCTLFVDGTVEWSGGTYRPMTYAPGGNVTLTDVWLSKGEFTIKAGAKLSPGAVSANGVFGAQQPTVGQQWVVIESQEKVSNLQAGPPVEGKWKIVLDFEPATQIVKKFKLEGIA